MPQSHARSFAGSRSCRSCCQAVKNVSWARSSLRVTLPVALKATLRRHGHDLHPGDILCMNDPFDGGMHLPDIFVFQPIFVDGQVVSFAATICHHTDVGGRVPGSNAADSTEIFQEGLRIPPLKLFSQGVMDETLSAIIALNVRVPDRVLGDLRAQYAACLVGASLRKSPARQPLAHELPGVRDWLSFTTEQTDGFHVTSERDR